MSTKTKVGNRIFWARCAIAEASQTATEVERAYIAGVLQLLDNLMADFGENYPDIKLAKKNAPKKPSILAAGDF